MTREEGKENALCTWQDTGITLMEMLDIVYDDVDSRVCSNCKHYQEIDDLKYCYELDEYDMKYCDRFKKEDDGIKEDH